MRRTVFLILGALELTVAVVLASLGGQLPSTGEVEQSFDSAERVTRRAGGQVRLSRQQIHDLRQPEIQQLADGLQTHTATVTATLRAQSVDYETVRALRDSMEQVSAGLDGLAETVDAARCDQLGKSFGETASYLDQGVVPAAEKTADDLDAATEALRTDARHLKLLLQATPLDLKTARAVHDSLARFGEGLDRMKASLRVQQLDTMRDGFRGLETALSTGADQVGRLADYTYPEVRLRGLSPQVTQQPFWPEGQEIAQGLRKAAAGVTAAHKELSDLAADLPKLQASLDESRKMVDRTREALALALRQQEQLEPVLKDMPAHAALLAESLPKLGADLARVLRGTGRLREVAASLRKAQKEMETAMAQRPELRDTLRHSASVLRTSGDQLDRVLRSRQQYEAAMHQTITLAETLSALLPRLAQQLNAQLQEQERALDDLGQSIDEVSTSLPAYRHTTTQVLQTGRLLMWLVAAVVALHGVYLVLSARLGRRYSL
jgi:chromosome segregation ATPase